jgi:UDP-4-amino-4,6-dideoxy-N-acetyl-beta-L-altrosamine N-acetyltransferase
MIQNPNDLQLIPLSNEHLEMVRKWRNMPEISQHMFNEDDISEGQQIEWFKKAENDPGQAHWVIQYKDEFAGLVSLQSINQKFNSCSWGFYIGNLKLRGEGVGYKALYRLLIKVFDEMNFNKINSEVLNDNQLSIKFHETLGFRREGYYREHILKNDTYIDVVALGYLKREWELLKDSLYIKIYDKN